MPKREVVQTVVVMRPNKDGKMSRLELTTGQVFNFTDEELEQIERGNPNAVSTTTTIDLSEDSDDASPKKVTSKLAKNQSSPPAATGNAPASEL